MRPAIYLKPDVLILLDQVNLTGPAKPIQVRYQVFNDDEAGRVTAGTAGFRITRPRATLEATVHAAGPVTVKTGQLGLPADDGVFPYAEVESAAATEHSVLTVATAQKTGDKPGSLTVVREGTGWWIHGAHLGRKIDARLVLDAKGLPAVAIA